MTSAASTPHTIATIGTTARSKGRIRAPEFGAGDGHAVQGDGEVCGTAIETPVRLRARLTVRKDTRVAAPEFLTPPALPAAEGSRRYVTNGIGPDLANAARDAVRRMIDWMGWEHGIGRGDAHMLCSIAVDLRISEIVDLPHVIVAAHCPIAIFEG